jgi:hypothetical protein
LDCHVCEGLDDHCTTCGGRGRILIRACPKSLLDAAIVEFLACYSDVGRGDWPAAGGTRDQTRSFLEAVRWMRREEDRWRQKLKIPEE